MLLDQGFNLTLRPMKYPQFYEMYKNAIKNTWTVEEVDFSTDVNDLRNKMTPSERHMINRLVAFFATGDSIVSNNLVLNLYKHINSPEARMYLSRQLYEEAVHVQFYLTLLDTYIPDHHEREQAFAAVNNIPSIHKKAEFCFKWIDSIQNLHALETKEDRKHFDESLHRQIVTMIDEAVTCEMQFAEDILSGGVSGLSIADMRQYLEFIADQRLVMLGLQKVYGAKNPFSFMDLQDVQELANFFERRVSAYQVAVAGDVSFNEAF
ncbi:MAG: ribonucleotide-diphosphate reductase subunit beta [Acidobacteria bacterium]|nr:ribonucleotide-diphosphate reductase subunit beta [Acidobacteriota bacterium]